MRAGIAGLVLVAALSGMPAHAAQDCRKDVETAFTKQRQSKAYRVVITNPSEQDGPEQVFEYLPPMTMYRKVTASSIDTPIETIGFGNRGWIMQNGGWFELQPHFAQMLENHMRDLFGVPPSIKTEYTCLGTVKFEGQDYAGYRTPPEAGSGGEAAVRTVYVDTATGLPAFNIISDEKGEKPPLVREAYSYPADLKIEIPEGAPMVENRH
jgi:hypothetical protein